MRMHMALCWSLWFVVYEFVNSMVLMLLCFGYWVMVVECDDMVMFDLLSVTFVLGEFMLIFTLSLGELNADVVKEFLADPMSLIFESSIFDF